ncbi:MAG: GlsB/YeaQ/YmgE family stress response membrane protein [Chloroflexi bacterium]|nr:GlsB/YeaQ/YmgE family stress response membrane protein [Chloroflexota bacterium]MCC6895772.1 GlsB/YeaQ/YmgE family stress response membrane protein [Anaerolineae bacterium]
MEFLTLNPIICVGWIIVGAIAGALARQIMRSQDQPFINDVILGLIGSVVGGFVAGLLGFARPDGGLDRVIINLIISVIGAVIVIYIGRLVRGRR